jgi:sarcosine oxidase subunit delta
MLLIHCPYCGEDRPEIEFRHAGEAHIARSRTIIETSDEDFEAFLYLRSNPKGIVFERWRHVHGCGRFFNAVRDTVTDRFFTTYKAGLPKPDPARFARTVAADEPVGAAAPVASTEARKTQPAAPAKAPRKAAASAAVGAQAPAAPPPNSAAPAAEPKPRRGSARAAGTAAPSETSAQASKPARSRRKTATAESAPNATGEASSDQAAPKRTRKSPAKKGEA